jgi:hypothetical protein
MAGTKKPKISVQRPKIGRSKQTAAVRQQYALARKKGGPLYGTGGS